MDTYLKLWTKKSTPKQRSYYSERHTLYLALSSLQTCPSLITKVGEQLADYFSCGGFVVTDQGGKVFRQSGVSGAQTRDFHHDGMEQHLKQKGGDCFHNNVIICQCIVFFLVYFNETVPEGIVVDVVESKIYWTDNLMSRIEMSNLDGSGRMTAIDTNLYRPWSIKVSQKRGWVYIHGASSMVQGCRVETMLNKFLRGRNWKKKLHKKGIVMFIIWIMCLCIYE